MTSKKPILFDPNKKLSIFTELIKQVKLVWLLFKDQRVSNWTKAILPFSAVYIISPLDFLPDVLLGLGQLDDLGILLLSMALFVKLCPPDIVAHHAHQLEYADLHDDKTVDTTYRVIDED